MDAFTEFEHEGWERVAEKYDSVWSSSTRQFIAPLLDKTTRSVRALAEIDNDDGRWRPGAFVAAAIGVGEQAAAIAVPESAIQTMDGGPAVFVRTPDGFQRRKITLGQRDESAAEVASGLSLGETIAVSNTFLLKAELLKGSADE